jgi:DnaJ-class molecular chaperone
MTTIRPEDVQAFRSAKTEGEIAKIYRKLSLAYHPDSNQGDAQAGARFQDLTNHKDNAIERLSKRASGRMAEDVGNADQGSHDYDSFFRDFTSPFNPTFPTRRETTFRSRPWTTVTTVSSDSGYTTTTTTTFYSSSCGTNKRGSKPCHFFATKSGCNKGDKCTFSHNFSP